MSLTRVAISRHHVNGEASNGYVWFTFEPSIGLYALKAAGNTHYGDARQSGDGKNYGLTELTDLGRQIFTVLSYSFEIWLKVNKNDDSTLLRLQISQEWKMVNTATYDAFVEAAKVAIVAVLGETAYHNAPALS